MNDRELIIETINKLFIYTDEMQWNKLQKEVFAKKVFLDMSSLGAEAQATTSKSICKLWNEGFKNIDAVNHLCGNQLVISLSKKKARAFAYATATHFKENAANGQTRTFVGTYDFELIKKKTGWRISLFKYNLKYALGNMDLT